MNKVKKNRTAKKSIIFVNQPYDISSGVNFKVNSFNNHAVMSASKHESRLQNFSRSHSRSIDYKEDGTFKSKRKSQKKKSTISKTFNTQGEEISKNKNNLVEN